MHCPNLNNVLLQIYRYLDADSGHAEVSGKYTLFACIRIYLCTRTTLHVSLVYIFLR